MPRIDRCPDEETLGRLLASDLTDSAHADVIEHIDRCEACQAEIERLGGDASSEPVLSPDETAATSSDALCGEVVARLVRIARGETLGTPSTMAVDAPVPEALGHFRIEGVIGRGGMGTVLKAWDTKLLRFVAIKRLRPPLMHDRDLRARILSEARAAGAIAHPHVVPVYSVHDESEPAFFVMEYVEGPSLQQVLHERPISVAEAVGIIRQVLESLAAAHACGVVHCDIKPANVLLESRTNRVRLTDFGISYAATAGDAADPEKYLGTPHYMSPEQCRGEKVDHRTDLFSTGVLLYRLLTGELPFAGETVERLKASIVGDRPVPVRQRRPDVPAALAVVVERLLQKSPEARFESATKVLQELSHAAGRSSPWRKIAIAVGMMGVIGVAVLIAPAKSKKEPDNWGRIVSPVAQPAGGEPPHNVAEPQPPPFFLGEPSKVKLVAAEEAGPIEIPLSGWRVVNSYRFNGRVRAAHFCPVDGSIWFSYGGREDARGIYRLGPDRVSREDRADERTGWVAPNPDRWRSNGAVRRILPSVGTTTIEFSPDGKLVAYQYDQKGTVRVADVRTGDERGAYLCLADRDNDPYGIAFVPENFTGSALAPGEILIVDFGYPRGAGSLWKCAANGPCAEIGQPGWLRNPIAVACSPTQVYVSQRAPVLRDQPDHPEHQTNRLIELSSSGFRPVETSLPIADAEGLKYDAATNGLLMVTRAPERLIHIDLSGTTEPRAVTTIATGFADARVDCLDLSHNGRYVLVTDSGTETVYILERTPPTR
jgi:tRNA A-37 threonylcarbamoyl transferase component Bud32